MNSKQRVYGPFYPSHALSSYTTDQTNQLNHWCEEIDHCRNHQREEASHEDSRSKIMKAAPTSFTN